MITLRLLHNADVVMDINADVVMDIPLTTGWQLVRQRDRFGEEILLLSNEQSVSSGEFSQQVWISYFTILRDGEEMLPRRALARDYLLCPGDTFMFTQGALQVECPPNGTMLWLR